jgi:dGTPase
VIRTLIDWQVRDLLEHAQRRLRDAGIGTVEDVRRCSGLLVSPGPEVSALKAELEAFLRRRVYRHYRVQRMALKGGRIVAELFAEFCRAPELLPDRYQRRIESMGRERTVCDYIAGMTDRYAQDEYLRLFEPYARV